MKPLRVDNWANFLLQRLQTLYEAGDQCDLILLFSTGVTIKVHSLVVNACTNYFQTLENRPWEETNSSVVILPEFLKDNILEPIIRFMYSGILELSEDTFYDLYDTAKFLKMTLLTKLLDARKSMSEKPLSPVDVKSESTKKNMDSSTSSLFKFPPGEVKPSTVIAESGLRETKYKWGKQKLPPYSGSIDCLETNDKQQAKVQFSNLQTDFKYPNFEDRRKEGVRGNDTKSKEIFSSTSSAPSSNVSLKKSTFCDELSLDEGVRSILKAIPNNDVPIKAEKRVHFVDQEGSSPSKQMKIASTVPVHAKNPKPVSSFSNMPKQVHLDTENEKDCDKAPHLFNEAEHQKILNKVLKKYPNMVRGNNLRLRIVQCASHKDEIKIEPSRGGDNKVAYLVLKAVNRHPSIASGEEVEEKKLFCRLCDSSLKVAPFPDFLAFTAHMKESHGQTVSLVCARCHQAAPQGKSHESLTIIRHDTEYPEGEKVESCISCQYVAVSKPESGPEFESNVGESGLESVAPESQFSTEKVSPMSPRHKGNLLRESQDVHNPQVTQKRDSLQNGKPCQPSQNVAEDINHVTQPSSEFQALSHVSHSIAASIAVSDPDPELSYDQSYQGGSDLEHPTITVEYSGDLGNPALELAGPPRQYTLVASQYQLSHVSVGDFDATGQNGMTLTPIHDSDPVTLVSFPSKVSPVSENSTHLLNSKSHYMVSDNFSSQPGSNIMQHKQIPNQLTSSKHNYAADPIPDSKGLQSNVKISISNNGQIYLQPAVDPSTPNHYSSLHGSDLKRPLAAPPLKTIVCEEEVGPKFEHVEEMLAVLHNTS